MIHLKNSSFPLQDQSLWPKHTDHTEAHIEHSWTVGLTKLAFKSILFKHGHKHMIRHNYKPTSIKEGFKCAKISM